MEKRFFIISLLMLLAVPAFAELTVEDTVNPEYLKNSGYSQATINVTQKIIAQDNGEALTEATEKEYYNNKFVKPIRRFFMYIDPSLDDHSFMNDHDIHTSPSINDL